MKFLLPFLCFLMVFLENHAQNTPEPCNCCKPEQTAFDFWVGNWEVTANGKVAGTNSILKLENGCVIQENWRSADGKFTGTSYNFYNHSTKNWEQLWIDNYGGNLKLEGGIKDGAMVMESQAIRKKDGSLQIDRITWTPQPDGAVRQLWQNRLIHGDEWNTVFDGMYRKVGK